MAAESYACECLDCGYTADSDEHCMETRCPKCGGEMRRAERPGVGNRGLEAAGKPYPNEHAGRLREPSLFQRDSFRRVPRKSASEKKVFHVIMGRPRGETNLVEQAYRYPVGSWTEEEAREHAKRYKCILFEPAVEKADEEAMKNADFLSCSLCEQLFSIVEKRDRCDRCGTELEPVITGMTMAEKGIRAPFGSMAGKKLMARKLIRLIPRHKTYVEPFAGAAAVFWGKEKVGKEVLSDLDDDTMNAYQLLGGMTDEEKRWLESQSWEITKANWDRAKAMKPKNRGEKFWKFKMEVTSSWGGKRTHFVDKAGYKGWAGWKRLQVFKDRLADVDLACCDWVETIRKYDGPETFFFIDPPYPEAIDSHSESSGFWGQDKRIPMVKMVQVIGAIKGKFVLTINKSDKTLAAFKKFHLGTLQSRAIEGTVQQGDTGQDAARTELIVANFPLTEKKAALEFDLAIKSAPERIVGGLVYKAKDPDSQDDWADEDVIRQAMHEFMEEGLTFSIGHEKEIEARVLECFQAEEDTKKGGGDVPKGAWWMTLRIVDDWAWGLVETGEVRGFSWEGLVLRKRGLSPA